MRKLFAIILFSLTLTACSSSQANTLIKNIAPPDSFLETLKPQRFELLETLVPNNSVSGARSVEYIIRQENGDIKVIGPYFTHRDTKYSTSETGFNYIEILALEEDTLHEGRTYYKGIYDVTVYYK